MSDAVKNYFGPFASLKMTVVLLAMATFLVFAGTVAQIDKGIWTVVDEYFRCAVTWIDLQIFFPRSWNVPGGFWYPGGWLIGGLLFANILAAHVVRFKVHARGRQLAAGVGVLAIGILLTWLIVVGVFNQDIAATEDAAFWRVLFRLAKGGGAAVVLMIGCLLVFKRRAGIVMLHSGIILLFVWEFVTGTYAVEGRMRIEAGQSMNYVEHTGSVELVFIDRSDPDVDRVTVIPAGDLARGGLIRNALLPVDVEVLRYMSNSRVLDATRIGPSVTNPATVGAGVQAIAVERPRASGVDQAQSVDVPAVYVTLTRKDDGRSLGTYLATPWIDGTSLHRQIVEVDGREHDLYLRFARTYKPYRIELIEFRHDKYVGTEKPRNFSSLVRLVDEAQGIDRTVNIWMNNPLRYAKETFYQSSFEPGRNVTILQVVRNDGWLLPYLSCMFVGVGLAVHMGGTLVRFLRRRVSP